MAFGSNLDNYYVEYLNDGGFNVIDTLVTKTIAALRDSNSGDATDLFLGATGKITLNVGGLNAVDIKKDDTNQNTVFEAINGRAIELKPANNSKQVILGGLNVMESGAYQLLYSSTKSNIEIRDNVQVTGSEVITGDLLTSGSAIANSMNVLRTFSNVQIGFGFRISEQSNLELYKFDNRTNLTKRIMIFGQGDGVGSNDTDPYPTFSGSSNASSSNSILGGMVPTESQWISSGSDIYYNLGNVGIGTDASATYRLNVDGGINFSGNLYQNGTLFSAGGGGWSLSGNNVYVTGNSNVGIGTSTPNKKLAVAGSFSASNSFFYGNMDVTGDINLTGSVITTSDERAKTNIAEVNHAAYAEIVKQIPIKSFSWREDLFPEMRQRETIGWIAQEIAEVFPRAVTVSEAHGYDDFHRVDTDMMNKALWATVRHLVFRVEELEKRLADA